MLTRLAVLFAFATLALMPAGCGGADGPVPDVVGERLDVAQGELEDQGFEVEALGGGTFGIVDESNWTVCETRPAAGASGTSDVKVIVDRRCDTTGGGSTAGGADDEAAEPSPPEDAPEPPAPSAASAARPRKITVPNVEGMNHQAAQNRMQSAGLFLLTEEDATGQGRMLLFDRNWVVVAQSPQPGARVREDRTIVLSSKKIGE
jgi:beta-lactam-binding protein with PASTA domain